MPLGSEHGNPGHRRSARPEATIGRAPRRGSLVWIMGRPAEVFRLWGGGIVAHVTMTNSLWSRRLPVAVPPHVVGGLLLQDDSRPGDLGLLGGKNAPAVVTAAREVVEGGLCFLD